MKILYLLSLLILMLMSCRPQIDNAVMDSTVFNYNFNGFTTEKSDTVKSNVWVSYELYLKPISTSLLKEVNKTIIVKPTIDKDLKTFYQLFDVEGKAISEEQRTGDVCTVSSEQLMNHQCYFKMKIVPPNELGKFNLSINTTWNGVSKNIVKPVFVIP